MELPLRGELKIFLGYAAGVGKTYQMLSEAQKLKAEGADIVIGYFEPHARKDTIAKTGNLEVVPRRKVEYRGAVFEEMDTDAILKRHPRICLVDEFAHTNVPGSSRAKRWEDVLALLEAGVDVLTTMNVQHLESLNDQVWQFTGVRMRETIPDWIMAQASEVVMVDITPRALLNRLERGVVYSPEKAREALQNFFQESTLVALRELAMRQTAHEVDVRQSDELNPGLQSAHNNDKADRILIYITPEPSSAALIRRAKRVADFLHAICFAVCVFPRGDLRGLPEKEREALERHLNFSRNLHIETRVLAGDDVGKTLVDFARLHEITQIFLARPRKPGFLLPFRRTLVQDIVERAKDMQVTIVADRQRNGWSRSPDSRQGPSVRTGT